MSRLFTTEGVVLRRFNLGEADLLVTLLSPDRGKLTMLAKGVRKLTSRFCGRLELGYRVRFAAHAGRNFGYFKEVEVIRGGQGFHLTFPGHAALGAMCEVTLRLLLDGQGGEVYPLLLEAMAALEKKEGEKSVFQTYLKAALTALGFRGTEDIFTKPLKSEAVLQSIWSG